MSQILITGGSGLLALNWALDKRQQHQVTLGIHTKNVSLSGINTCLLSLDSTDKIQQVFDDIKPNIVIHTAGLTNVEQCEANPDLAYYTNVELAKNVAKACLLDKVSLVHISTDHLFSDEMCMADEHQNLVPMNIYGRTKAEAEHRVLDIYPETLIVRTNFYGWGPSFKPSFSDIIIDSLRSDNILHLFQDVFYTPILIESLVKAVHDLLNKKVSGIFHVAGDERISKFEFGLEIAKLFNLDTRLIKKTKLQDQRKLTCRPKDMSLSNQKVTKVLGRTLGGVKEQLLRLQEQETLGLVKEIKNL